MLEHEEKTVQNSNFGKFWSLKILKQGKTDLFFESHQWKFKDYDWNPDGLRLKLWSIRYLKWIKVYDNRGFQKLVALIPHFRCIGIFMEGIKAKIVKWLTLAEIEGTLATGTRTKDLNISFLKKSEFHILRFLILVAVFGISSMWGAQNDMSQHTFSKYKCLFRWCSN